MNKKIACFIVFNFVLVVFTKAQPDRWQQRVKYTMNVKLNVKTNIVNGTEKLVYTNNSPDQLDKVYFHLYWNAFQPGSEMDVRSRELGKTLINGRPDWDDRVKDRISKLDSSQIGFQRIKSLKMNGVEQPTVLHGTILEVNLQKPIDAKSKVTFDIAF